MPRQEGANALSSLLIALYNTKFMDIVPYLGETAQSIISFTSIVTLALWQYNDKGHRSVLGRDSANAVISYTSIVTLALWQYNDLGTSSVPQQKA